MESINTNWLTIGQWKILCQPILAQEDQTYTVYRSSQNCGPRANQKKTSTLPCYATKNHPCPTSMGWKIAPSHPNLGSSQRLPQSPPPPPSRRSQRRHRRGRRRSPWRAGPARGQGSASHGSDRQSLGVDAGVLFDFWNYEVMRNFNGFTK